VADFEGERTVTFSKVIKIEQIPAFFQDAGEAVRRIYDINPVGIFDVVPLQPLQGTIKAIRAVRTLTNLPLKESKDAVEAWVRNGTPIMETSDPDKCRQVFGLEGIPVKLLPRSKTAFVNAEGQVNYLVNK
jgi:ribosomal protein L7/L12